MGIGNDIVSDVVGVWNTYRPIMTEVEGMTFFAKGIQGVAYSIFWRMTDNNDLGTGIPLATQALQISALITVGGITRLVVPIAAVATYAIWRYYGIRP